MKNLKTFKEHVLKCYPQEACGAIIEDIFVPFENVHSDPINFFELSQEISSYLADKEYKLIHSHTMESFSDDPRIPSLEDMQGQQNSSMPWGIVHCDGIDVSDILWLENPEILKPDLEGRKYIPNIQDCFTLARDFYLEKFNIDFGTHPRPADWEEWNPHYIANTYTSLGFIDIPKHAIAYGDIVLFSIGASTINHIGIYLGDDKFLHHLHRRTSAIDSFSKWDRQFRKALRLLNEKII